MQLCEWCGGIRVNRHLEEMSQVKVNDGAIKVVLLKLRFGGLCACSLFLFAYKCVY